MPGLPRFGGGKLRQASGGDALPGMPRRAGREFTDKRVHREIPKPLLHLSRSAHPEAEEARRGTPARQRLTGRDSMSISRRRFLELSAAASALLALDGHGAAAFAEQVGLGKL